MIRNDTLAEYAHTLADNGFTIYEPKGESGDYFMYSRMVDGVECFGSVQQCTLRLEGYSHAMPIKPSRVNGSNMFVGSVADGWDNLTVEAARTVASPTNWNSIVGTQSNYRVVNAGMYEVWENTDGPSFPDSEGKFRNMFQVKAANRRAGHDWFTIGGEVIGFRGRALIGGRYWVEKGVDNRFRVAAVQPNGDITYIGDDYSTADNARDYIVGII